MICSAEVEAELTSWEAHTKVIDGDVATDIIIHLQFGKVFPFIQSGGYECRLI